MASIRALLDREQRREKASRSDIRLLFYLGVPALTALLFAMNKAGMARHLPGEWAIPYWLGITIPLWVLLDGCSRALFWALDRFDPHRWLVLLAASLLAMAIFSPYVAAYARLFGGLLPQGVPYTVATPFPEAFLDLRRFAAYSSVPIYWIAVASFFHRYFGFPPYLAKSPTGGRPLAALDRDRSVASEPGMTDRSGFRALVPYHLGDEVLSLNAEDHYVRVVTEHGNALIRYRFSDALREVRSLQGIQVHRSHWVAVSAIAGVRTTGKAYCLTLKDGTELPVSRTNVGVLRQAGLI